MERFLNSAVYGAKRSAIREFSKLAQETEGCLRLTLGEPDFDTPLPVREAAIRSLNNHETHYIANNGAPALLKAISEFEKKKGLCYAPEEIIVTAGATEALFVSLFGILNPGDEVVIPTPAFVLYEEIVKLCRAVPVFLDTSKDGFQLTKESLSSVITPKTKAILINSPNNPSGTVYGLESYAALHDAVKDKPIFVLCDDVYRELCYEEEYHSFAEYTDLRKQLLVIQSFSKPYAMTGWRVGYLMADAAIKERLELIHQFMVVSTPAPFQKACIEALKVDPSSMVETYRKRRAYICSRLDAMGLSYPAPKGAFYIFPSIEKFGLTSDEFCRRMIREVGLAATPGFCFGAEGYIRLSYCYSDEELKECLDRLEQFIHSL